MRALPRTVWVRGFVGLFTDFFSVMISGMSRSLVGLVQSGQGLHSAPRGVRIADLTS
jgi:hypothetical protein